MILLKSENKDATTFNEVNECDDNMKMNVNLRRDALKRVTFDSGR